MNFAQLIGWTLIHSIWEIAGVAALLFVVGLFIRSANPRVRYALALVALCGCLVGPVATYFVLAPSHPRTAEVQSHLAVAKFAPSVAAKRIERSVPGSRLYYRQHGRPRWHTANQSR